MMRPLELESRGSSHSQADTNGCSAAAHDSNRLTKSSAAAMPVAASRPSSAAALRVSARSAPVPEAGSGRRPMVTNNEGAYSAVIARFPLPPPPAFSVPWCLQWPLFFTDYVADAYVQRGTAVIYLTLCIIGVVWRSSPWLWYIVAGLCADSGFRAIAGDRLAVLSVLAEMVTMWLPGSYPIASAPRQLTAWFFTVFNFIAVMMTGYVLGDADPHNDALGSLLAVEAALMLLELLGLSFPALFFERVMLPCGLVSDAYLHKAEAVLGEQRLKMAVGKAKLQHTAHAHTVVVEQENGNVLMTFHGLANAGRTAFDPIRNCTAAYCFPLLGIAGLVDLFFYGTQLVGLNSYVWKSLAIFLLICFVSYYSLQIVRAFLVPQALVRELQHPHLRYVYLITLTVPLLSIDYMLTVNYTYCKVILWFCAPLVGVAALKFLNDWITQPMTFELLNSSWLIAIIALIVVAFELPQVYPEWSELAWLWLAFGLFMWAVMVALILCRLIFTPPLPDAQRSTFFLVMSTGAVATAAVVFQDPRASVDFIGPYSTLAEFFHWMTTFVSIICYMLLLKAYFGRSPFNVSYWALSFPSSALALIWLFYYKTGNCSALQPTTQSDTDELCINNQDSRVIQGVVILLYVNACVSNSILGVNTVLAVMQKRLFMPMPRWSPAACLQLQHAAFRTALYKADRILAGCTGQTAPAAAAASPAKPSPLIRHSLSPRPLGQDALCPCALCVASGQPARQQKLSTAAAMLSQLHLALRTYMRVKRDVLWPVVQRWIPQVHLSHVEQDDMTPALDRLTAIIFALERLAAADECEAAACEVEAGVASLQRDLYAVATAVHVHLDHEEVMLSPLVHQFLDLTSAKATMVEIWQAVDCGVWREVLPWLLSMMPDHSQRMALIDCFNWASQEVMGLLGRWLALEIDPFLYGRLCVDYPALALRGTSPHAKFW